jgi:hypothetical protein
MFTHRGKAMEHDKRGGGRGGGVRQAESGRPEWRGRTTQGKWAADNTTRGLSSQQQKKVEPACAGVCLCQRHCASVAIAPGEGGAGTYRRQSRGAINNDC